MEQRLSDSPAAAVMPAEATGARRPSGGRWPVRRAPVSLAFVARRSLGALVAIWGAVSVVFVMLLLAGNPAEVLAPETATPEQVAELARAYGFDQPIPVQYLRFWQSIVTGQFPQSLYTDRPAFREVFNRVPATLMLSLTAVVLGTIVGLAVGYWSATSSWTLVRDMPLRFLMVFQSMPSFFLGLVLVLIFSLTFRWLPTSGMGSWKHMVLPVLTLSAYVAPSVARLFRSTIREMAFEEHVQTARAKGISARQVRIRHIAINALGPVVALIGLQAGGVLGGAVVTETVFAWPGVGELLVRSVGIRDYPVVLATVMVICLGFVLASLLVDIVVAMINPRLQERK